MAVEVGCDDDVATRWMWDRSAASASSCETQNLRIGMEDYRVVKDTKTSMQGDSKFIDQQSGMKIWESSCDLVAYMQNLKTTNNWSVTTKVLEIGCGHGLPGIFTLLSGASVHLQDYSKNTLQQYTSANIALNQGLAKNDKKLQDVTFWSGEWKNVCVKMLEEGLKFDVILCAECIYNEEQYAEILYLLEKLLAKKGFALVAGKRFYFGCSGGTAGFLDAVSEPLCGEEIWVSEDGMSNVREILKIQYKK